MLIFKNVHLYKAVLLIAVLLVLLSGCTANNINIYSEQVPTPVEITDSEQQDRTIEELAEEWAYALISRDGKPRYDMMSDQAKERFVQEQKVRSGEDWNYNIGYSSPTVYEYSVELEGMTATLTYNAKTSEPAYYSSQEKVTFTEETGQLLVEEYETVYENKVISK